MAKGKPNPNWKKLVQEWMDSGKSARVWCTDNQIPFNTLCGWRKRLKLFGNNNTSNEFQQAFVELKNLSPDESGVVLETDGVKIHLRVNFNITVLKQCLDCLKRGRSC